MWLSLLIGLFLSDLRNIYAVTLNFGNQNQVSQIIHTLKSNMKKKSAMSRLEDSL